MISADGIRGYIDLLVLSLVRDQPSYAYEIAQQINTVAGSDYAVKQTTLYSAVKRLETATLVESFAGTSDSGKPRTYYRITDAGREHLREKIAEWQLTKSVIDRFIEGDES